MQLKIGKYKLIHILKGRLQQLSGYLDLQGNKNEKQDDSVNSIESPSKRK